MQIAELQARILQFRDERDWKKFHSPKNIASAISIEAGELQEHFLWNTEEQSYETAKKEDVADELADIFSYVLLFAHEAGIDVGEALLQKIQKNGDKYPVEKAKGVATKYTNL